MGVVIFNFSKQTTKKRSLISIFYKLKA